jgi:magnesium transporter
VITYHPVQAEPGAPPPDGTVWIDLLEASEAEVEMIEAYVGHHLPTRDQLAEIQQSSRQLFKNGVLRLSAPMLAVGDDKTGPHLTQVGLVLTPRLLITVRDQHLQIFEAVAESSCAPHAPTNSPLVFTALLEAFVDRQADLLEEARAHLDEVSHAVFRVSATNPRRVAQTTMIMRRKLQTLGRVGERISLIRESLLTVDRAVPFTLEATKDWFAPDLVHRLGDVRADVESLNQFEEHLLGKVQFLLDAVLGFIGIEQNDIFKVLTVASVVGIFPTLVAGWYGMNFHNMPEYDWAFGYQWGIGAIVLSTIIPLAWFKWRGWM